jgi:hypothetical protein
MRADAEILIESVNPDEGTESMEQPVTDRLTYGDADSGLRR